MELEDSPFQVGDRVLFCSSPGNTYQVLAVLPNMGVDALGHTKNLGRLFSHFCFNIDLTFSPSGFSFTLRNRVTGAICQGQQFSLRLDSRVLMTGGGYGSVQNPTLSQLQANSWAKPSPPKPTITPPPAKAPLLEQEVVSLLDDSMDSDEEDLLFKVMIVFNFLLVIYCPFYQVPSTNKVQRLLDNSITIKQEEVDLPTSTIKQEEVTETETDGEEAAIVEEYGGENSDCSPGVPETKLSQVG